MSDASRTTSHSISNRAMLSGFTVALLVSAAIGFIFYFDLSERGRISQAFIDLSWIFLTLFVGLSAGFGLVVALIIAGTRVATRGGGVVGFIGGILPTAFYLTLRFRKDVLNREVLDLPSHVFVIALGAMFVYVAVGAWLGRQWSR